MNQENQSDENPNPPPFPRRMFAPGDEPVGVRVTPYHKPSCIRKILGSLDPDEIQFIRDTPFGKLVQIAESPSFSGRFGRFLLSRQLKVAKKHEVWFLFAGRPVRFSLREFALVTGLNCQNYPRHTKKNSKRNMLERPYWGELFGTLSEVPVSHAINMLKKKTVVDKETRLKYALLALLSAVILPTCHNPRILHPYAEKIKDMDQFLAYPWGRTSFEMLISSIKERDEVSLSQKTIALKGFVLAIQLVMIQAAPSLLRVVQAGGSSGSEGSDDDDFVDDDNDEKKSINPARVRDIDAACKIGVVSIISDGVEINNVSSEIHWSDDEEDVLVSNMEKCIHDGFRFTNSNFVGGASTADVNRMREDAIKEVKSRKNNKGNVKPSQPETIDAEYVVSNLRSCFSSDISRLEKEVKNIGHSLKESHSEMRVYIQDMFDTFQRNIEHTMASHFSRAHFDTAPESHADIPPNVNKPDAESNPPDPCSIIQDALLFANTQNPQTGNVPFVGVSLNEETNPSTGVGARNKDSMATMSACDDTEEANTHEVFDETVNESECAVDTETVINRASVGDVVGSSLADGAQPTASDSVEDSHTPSLSVPEANPNLENLQTNPVIGQPSFSLGLTQEERLLSMTVSAGGDNCDESVEDVAPISLADNQDLFPTHRRSKRQRVATRALVGDYHCDKQFLSRAWEAHVNDFHDGPSVDYAAKALVLFEKLETEFVINIGGNSLDNQDLAAFLHRSSNIPAKVVDVLISHTSSLVQARYRDQELNPVVFLDTKFVSLLSQTFSKFSKSTKKDSYRFPPPLIQYIGGNFPITEASRVYFPFNFDKKHWIGVCLDLPNSQVILLDCNTSLRSDTVISKEIRHITEMFPYLLRRAAKLPCSKSLKALGIERPRIVPQNHNQVDSAMTSILLLQAHAFAGIDVCRCITPDVIGGEVQRAAVMIYEDNVGTL